MRYYHEKVSETSWYYHRSTARHRSFDLADFPESAGVYLAQNLYAESAGSAGSRRISGSACAGILSSDRAERLYIPRAGIGHAGFGAAG